MSNFSTIFSTWDWLVVSKDIWRHQPPTLAHSNIRINDVSDKGFHDWVLTSVETWSEPGHGEWRMYIINRGEAGLTWSVGHTSLILHGVEKPSL